MNQTIARLWAPFAVRSRIRRIRQDPQLLLPRVGRRLIFGLHYSNLTAIVHWALTGSEDANFSYDLTATSRTHLVGFVATVTGEPLERVGDVIREAEQDAALRAQIGKPLGRRLGWYAIARILQPELVIETGVDEGMGACSLCAALLRNGHGRYIGTDISHWAGRLLTPPYSTVGQILRGDSIESLRTVTEPVGLFINDSDHSAGYERREYDLIAPKLAPNAVVLGDNVHATTELYDFAMRTGRRFVAFREQPRDHWYPGAGIGAAW